jgi:hypothetical protein
MTMRTKAIIGLVLMLAMAACGDDSATSVSGVSTTATSAPAVSTTTSPASSATPSLTLVVEELVGFEGMVVSATLYTTERNTGGSVCIPVDADPWTGSGVFTSAPFTNPCEKTPPYGEVITEEGDFLVSFGVYRPDSGPPPLACATVTVTIAGPSEVTISADDLGPDC